MRKNILKLLKQLVKAEAGIVMAGVLILSVFMFFRFEWGGQQFTYLAKAYLSGKPYFLEKPGSWWDTVRVDNKYYWPLGQLPAVMLTLPVKIYRTGFWQGYLQLAMLFLTAGLGFVIARKGGFPKWHSAVLAFGFCFASVYHMAAGIPTSWYISHGLAVVFILAALGESLTAKRFWVIGILMAAVLWIRFTAGLGVVYFLFMAWEGGAGRLQKLKRVGQLVMPLVLSVVMFLIYNRIIFGSMFSNGYRDVNATFLNVRERFELVNYGLFKIKNIPTNFYYYFIKMPDPITLKVISYWGRTFILKPPYVTTDYPGVSFFC